METTQNVNLENKETTINKKVGVERKLHSNKKRIILTALIIVLTAIVALVAVMAYITQDFTISNKVSFEARAVQAYVTVSCTNAGQNVDIEHNAFDINKDDPTGTYYGVIIPSQAFIGIGEENALEFNIRIENTGNSTFSAIVDEFLTINHLSIDYNFYLNETKVNNNVNVGANDIFIFNVKIVLLESANISQPIAFSLSLCAV